MMFKKRYKKKIEKQTRAIILADLFVFKSRMRELFIIQSVKGESTAASMMLCRQQAAERAYDIVLRGHR